MQRGRLIFNNGPVGDPGIDLRAQKEFPDITAGVNVRGSLRSPRMTFFSEPAIPQSQIAIPDPGRRLAGNRAESSSPGAARNDLLAQGGAILAQQIGSARGHRGREHRDPTFSERHLAGAGALPVAA